MMNIFVVIHYYFLQFSAKNRWRYLLSLIYSMSIYINRIGSIAVLLKSRDNKNATDIMFGEERNGFVYKLLNFKLQIIYDSGFLKKSHGSESYQVEQELNPGIDSRKKYSSLLSQCVCKIILNALFYYLVTRENSPHFHQMFLFFPRFKRRFRRILQLLHDSTVNNKVLSMALCNSYQVWLKYKVR